MNHAPKIGASKLRASNDAHPNMRWDKEIIFTNTQLGKNVEFRRPPRNCPRTLNLDAHREFARERQLPTPIERLPVTSIAFELSRSLGSGAF